MKIYFGAFISLFLFGSCSSSRLVDEFVNQDSKGFRASKVLVIGLERLKQYLLSEGFDGVFFSRITGKDTKVTLAQSYRNLTKTFEIFSEYSEKHTTSYNSEDLENYPVLHTETFYYCLCPENKNDLIWKGNIDIVNASTSEESIQDYVKTLLKALNKNNLLPKE